MPFLRSMAQKATELVRDILVDMILFYLPICQGEAAGSSTGGPLDLASAELAFRRSNLETSEDGEDIDAAAPENAQANIEAADLEREGYTELTLEEETCQRLRQLAVIQGNIVYDLNHLMVRIRRRLERTRA
jgi:hypothetical protein